MERILGLGLGIPACAQLIVSLVQGMALLKNPDANITALWQATLLIFLFLLLMFSFNIFLAKYLPVIENTMVCTAYLLATSSNSRRSWSYTLLLS